MAKTVVLVGCGKGKLSVRSKAKDLYMGPLFRKARAYAERFGDEWAILSAKHFLVMPDEEIDPYDLCLGDLDKDYLAQWIGNTNWAIRSRWKTWENSVLFVVLAGKDYARALSDPTSGRMVRVSAKYPLEGMSIGQRLQFLNRALEGSKDGHSLHHRDV